jgi:hypothetical protein
MAKPIPKFTKTERKFLETLTSHQRTIAEREILKNRQLSIEPVPEVVNQPEVIIPVAEETEIINEAPVEKKVRKVRVKKTKKIK